MAYEVTATRRRPQKFEDLVGQDFVAETIRNSIQSGKIAHAYLFSGPRGCGKTSTARILAKALNCVNGPTASPCGVCPHCQEITRGSCTDVIEIDGASNTGVNDVRAIKDEVLFPPQSCNYKIYIIDEVHMLSNSAFNALLKTIEEPPPKVIFIFATTELHKVPATIKSRCQQFNFRLVPIEKVKQLLAEACAEIGIEAEDEALYWIARESTGSIRDAYTLFDQVAAFSADKITYEKIRDKLGLLGVDRLNALFEDCAQNKTQDALEKLDGFLEGGISIEQLITNSTDYMRSLLLIKNGITREALLGQAAERFSTVVLGAWNPIQIERGISLLLQLYRDIRYSLNPRYELELAISRLSWLSKYVSPAEVKAAIEGAKMLLQGSAAGTGGTGTAGGPGLANAAGDVNGAGGATTGAGGSFQASGATNAASGAPQTFGATGGSGGVVAPIAPQAQGRPLFTFSALRKANTSPSQEQTAAVSGVPDSSPASETFSNSKGFSETSSAASVSDSGSWETPPDTTTPSSAWGGQSASFESSSGGSPSPFVDGGTTPPENKDLRSQATGAIMTENAPLAATLMRTQNWRENAGVITAEVDSKFTQTQIQAQGAKINELISRAIGRSVTFRTVLHVQEQVNPAQDAPEPVKILCNTFKGTIVTVAPHVDYEDESEANASHENENEDGSTDSQMTGEEYTDESL